MQDIKYKIEPIDYITFQLFTISRNEKVQSRIKKNKIIVPAIYVIFASVFFILNNFLLGALFILLSIIWYIFYPGYQHKRYKRYYTRYINTNYESQFEASSNVIIDENFAYLNSKEDKVRIKLNEISEVDEIKTHLFIKFINGNTLIIPKGKIKEFKTIYEHIRNIINAKSSAIRINNDWHI